MSSLTVFLLALFSTMFGYSLRLVKEYERAVIYTLGRYSGVKGPGMIFIIPVIQAVRRIDVRARLISVEGDVLSSDNQSLRLSADVYFQVKAPEKAANSVADYMRAMEELTRTAMREKSRSRTRGEILDGIENLSSAVCKTMDAATGEWGITVSNVVLRHPAGASIPVNQPA